MRSARLWTRLAASAVLTAALLFLALRIVPGTTWAVQARMMLFVFGGPWLVASLVVHPLGLRGALSAVFLNGKGDGRATVGVLECLGGLTVAAGAVGAFGSWISFWDAFTRYDESPSRVLLPGAVAAMIMPPAFAVMLRLTLFEPVVRSLRRKLTPEDPSRKGTEKMPARWKVAVVVVAAVLFVEGFRVLVLAPAEEPEKPVQNTTLFAVGADPASGRQSPDLPTTSAVAEKPIRVEIVPGESGPECRVDGTPLTARPGRADEIHHRLVALKKQGSGRCVEIAVAPAVPFKHLVAAMDACIRVRKTALIDYRILVPSKHPFALAPRIRLAEEPRRRRDVLILQLPRSDLGEPVLEHGDEPTTINIPYDPRTGHAEIRANRHVFTPAELKAWIDPLVRSQTNQKTGASEIPVLIRCDQDAPVRTVFEVLSILAGEDLRVEMIWFEVSPGSRWPWADQ